MKNFVFAVITIFCVTAAHAEKWIRFDDFYIDEDSVTKRGDIAEVNVRLAGTRDAEPIMMDCKQRTVFVKQQELSAKGIGLYEKILEIGCRKRWEFWK